MAVRVQRTDLYVGLFLVTTIALVVAALVATSGWGVDRYDIFVRTNNADAITVDTKIFMQGLEVGRVASIAPRPAGEGLEFIIRLSLLDRFPDGQPLRLPKSTVASVETSLLGASTLTLLVDTAAGSTGGTLGPSDTIRMERHAAAMDAFAALANDLKGQIQTTLATTDHTLEAATRLADSVANAAGAGRRFLVDVQPGTERALSGVAGNLDRLQALLDSTNHRTGVTMAQLNAVLAQSRTVMVSADSLTNLLVAMGGENRPEINAIIENMRFISEQMQYVLEQLGRRPTRAITGIKIPDSLTVEGRARRDSARAAEARADSATAESPHAAPADSTHHSPAPAGRP